MPRCICSIDSAPLPKELIWHRHLALASEEVCFDECAGSCLFAEIELEGGGAASVSSARERINGIGCLNNRHYDPPRQRR